MAVTPATRVSQVLHKGGLPTTEPGSRREGNKVRNNCSPASLAVTRRFGQPVVTVTADFDLPSLAAERVGNAEAILTAAGYRVERSTNPGSYSLRVWEPNWRTYLDPSLTAAKEPATEPAAVELRADRMRDGRVLVHVADCPAPPPGKSMPLRGQAREAVAAEVAGTLIKGIPSDRLGVLIDYHDCARSVGGPRDTP